MSLVIPSCVEQPVTLAMNSVVPAFYGEWRRRGLVPLRRQQDRAIQAALTSMALAMAAAVIAAMAEWKEEDVKAAEAWLNAMMPVEDLKAEENPQTHEG